jgi:hypothetical protein
MRLGSEGLRVRARGVWLGAVPCVGWLVVSTDLLRVWAQAIVTADDGGPVKKKFVASEEWHGSVWMSVWE